MRSERNIIVCVFLLGFFIFLSGCNKEVADKKITPSKKTVIGLSLPDIQADRWMRDKQAIEDELKKNDIDLIFESADMSADKQEVQCINMLSKGISVLILIPYDSNKSASIVEKAHAKNVKVISYDRLVMGADVDYYITFDNEQVGQLQAECLTRSVSKGNYIVLSGSPNDNNSKYLLSGTMDVLKPLIEKGDIKIIHQESVSDWSPDIAYEIIRKVLTSNKNIHAILAPNDCTAGGCVKALEEFGLDGKVFVTGQDAELSATKRILKGTQLMTVFKDIRLIGARTADIAVSIVKNGNFESKFYQNNNKANIPTLLIKPTAVDKANLDKELVQSGFLRSSSVYSD